MKNTAILMGIMLVAGTVLADLSIVQKIEPNVGSGKATVVTMTLRIKGSKAKIDFKPESQSSMIDLQAGKIYLMDPSSKQVMIMPLATMKAAMTMAGKALAGNTGKLSLQKTGNTKVINGFTCSEYTGGSAGINRTTCWVAEDADTKELDPFHVFVMSSAKIMGLETLDQLKGMLIVCDAETTFRGKKTRNRLEVQSVSRAALDDAVFTLPADYRTMELPPLP